MNLAVIGTGYVGLVSGVCLASRGHRVTCVDQRSEVVDSINRGIPPIHEEGLPELLHREVLEQNRLRATLNLGEALEEADLILVAVGTPSDAEGRMDTQYLEGAVRQVGTWFREHGRMVPLVIKSTVLPGTTDTMVAGWLSEETGVPVPQLPLGMNPEFLREGQAIADFQNPDRIVLGATHESVAEKLHELYASYDVEKVVTNPRTAELIKYANNALLALQISAANELANLASAMGGIDISEVLKGVYLDHRWNPVRGGERANPAILTYLKPGCGFGGSCFPKDVSALTSRGKELGLPMDLWTAVLEVNRRQPGEVVRLLRGSLGENWAEGCRVGLLGLAFKPGTDDIRESASLRILRDLLDAGATVAAHDPVALEPARKAVPDKSVRWVEDWKEIIPQSDILIVATTWPEYAELPSLLKETKSPVHTMVDPRRMYTPSDFDGLRFLSIGYTPVNKSTL